MSFYICHCGYPETSHINFRHRFEKIALVKRDLDEIYNEFFILETKNFPSKTVVRCKKDNCLLSDKLHETEIVSHKYIPENVSFKEINFCVPYDAICYRKKCCISLKDHKEIQTHLFEIKLILKDKTNEDIVLLKDEEFEDLKLKLV